MPTFYAGQPDYIAKLNELDGKATVSLTGTISESLTLSSGTKTFTTDTLLQLHPTSRVNITRTSDITKYMSGVVLTYNQDTGAMTVDAQTVVGSGTFSDWTITLSGAAGATGAAGADGADGIADNISIGTVTSGTAAASITGTSPNKFLNLTLQTGATGAAGAPNVLSIGTVTGGVTADATITGTSPSQVLNLVLPKGDTGDTGATGDKGLNARGAWNGATAYLVDDWVTYSGSSYYRKIAGTTGTDPATDTTNWGILALKGADGTGAVSSVSASAPLASSGGATPNITIQVANTSQSGYLTNTDWNTFNGKAPLVSPSFTTPSLGVATASTINKVTLTAPATSATITIANGKTFTSSNTLTFTGTDGSTLNVGTGGILGTAAYTASTAYAPAAGSASVTTLGTVTTGTWNATVIAGQYGGTGVNNSGKTLTLGGNHVNSGAFASTFTFTGTTNVTFPTSGTLATTSDLASKASTGANTFTGSQVLSDNQLSRAMLLDTGHVFLDKGSSGTSTQTLDFSAGSHQKITATGNHSFSFSNFPPTGNTGFLLFEATNYGAFTITPPTVNWVKPDGTFTTSLSTYLAALAAVGGRAALATSGIDFMLFWSRDAGTTVYGKLI